MALLLLVLGCTDPADGTDKVNPHQGDTAHDLEGDSDGDGTADADDCAPDDPTASPTATERCDGIDNNCDGATDEGFDADSDGWLVDSADCRALGEPTDCADDDPEVHPEATERCNGLDDDCDGLEDDAPDADGDGYDACTDCDDAERTTNPGAPDGCDALDNNCDGTVDEAFDADGDGTSVCQGDCDDHDPLLGAGDPETCDGIDNDCDGDVDEDFDTDGDGFRTCDGDCDDTDSRVWPGAVEVCDGVDNDCDASTDERTDADADGATACTGDCDDTDPSRPAVEACDGIDNDCDDVIDDGFDEDGDGWRTCDADCDDGAPTVNPGTPERCDGLDNDCDPATLEAVDTDGDGYTTCTGDCDDADPDDAHPDADCDRIPDAADPHPTGSAENLLNGIETGGAAQVVTITAYTTADGAEASWDVYDGDLSAGCANAWKPSGALCDESPGTDDPTMSVHADSNAGPTWGGGDLTGVLIVDACADATCAVIDVDRGAAFQMYSDGKTTHVRVSTHTELGDAPPSWNDPGWTPLVDEFTNLGAGNLSHDRLTVTEPSTFAAPYSTLTRYIRVEARNDGTLGDAGWIELRALKLFGAPPVDSEEVTERVRDPAHPF